MPNSMNQDSNSGVKPVNLHMQISDTGAGLLDWALHHHRMGFETITVYGDGRNAETEKLGMLLDNAGLITFKPSENDGSNFDDLQAPQALADSLANTDSDQYLLWLNPHEYVYVDAGEGTLAELFARVPQRFDFMSLTTQFVGGGNVYRYEDRPVTERFKRGAGGKIGQPIFAPSLRTIFSPDYVKSLTLQRPALKPKFKKNSKKIVWLDGAGEDTEGRYIQKGWLAPRDNPGFGIGRVLSYYVQDRETWLLHRLAPGGEICFITPESLKETISDFYRYNFNQVAIDHMDATTQRIHLLKEKIFAEYPDIQTAHLSIVKEHSSRLSRLLEDQDKSAIEIISVFMSGNIVQKDKYNWEIPAGRKTTKIKRSADNSKWLPLFTEDLKDSANETEIWKMNTDDTATVSKPASNSSDAFSEARVPSWLVELRVTDHANGFYHSMQNYACTYIERSYDTLVVSFDNLASVRDNPVIREPWGYEFVKKNGWSHLNVHSFVPAWYRDRTLHHYLEGLRDENFFKKFKNITMFGTSMGGFGAAAFASLAPGCKVVAFSPQSSLAQDIAPWDFRYPAGRQSDWDGPFRDAAAESLSASEVWLFYDPRVEFDRQHVERFSGTNVTLVPLRHAGHKTALILRNGNVLSKVTKDIIEGRASLTSTLRHYRMCRPTPIYLTALRELAENKGGPRRLAIVEKAIKKVFKPQKSG